MRAALLALVAAALAMSAWCQPPPVLQMDYSNPSLTPSHWTFGADLHYPRHSGATGGGSCRDETGKEARRGAAETAGGVSVCSA